jgi:hypothetical protein
VSGLVDHTNEMSHDVFGVLTPESRCQCLDAKTPVLATPTSVTTTVAIFSAVQLTAGGVSRPSQ